jgi:F-box and leucine-rich repeat protein 2/20
MNLRNEIDNEDVLFQFDVGDTLKRGDSLDFPSRPALLAHPERSQPSPHKFSKMQRPNIPSRFISDDGDIDEGMLVDKFSDVRDTKGKGVSQPMLIRRMANHDQHDTFALSLESSFSSGTSLRFDPTFSLSPLTSSSTPNSPNSSIEPGHVTLDLSLPSDPHLPITDVNFPGFADHSSVGKGKAREHTTSLPPVLPPLLFSSTLSSDNEWSQFLQSSVPGPSSYNSSAAMTYDSPIQTTPFDLRPSDNPMNSSSSNDGFMSIIRRPPSRRHSFSNLSVHSRHSVTAQSLYRAKVKSRSASNIARKLLFRKRSDTLELSSGGSVAHPNGTANNDLPVSPRVGQSSCFLPGCVDLKNMIDDDAFASVPAIDFSNVTSLYAQSAFPKPTDTTNVKTKGRSYSSPFPLTSSPLDIISFPEVSISSPVRVDNHDLFDELLPRELKLHILSLFVASYEADFLQLITGKKWTAIKASSVRNKWVGRDKGVRELIKLGRVSISLSTLVRNDVIGFNDRYLRLGGLLFSMASYGES